MFDKRHTPGPWMARPVPNVGVKGHTGYAIDFNDEQEQVVDFVYEAADAHLIASAPDLLSALERLTAAARDVDSGYLDAAVSQAEDAIAKAQGQQ